MLMPVKDQDKKQSIDMSLSNHVRAGAIKEAAYDEIKIEPRLDPHSNQRRADISFIDKH